MNKPTLTKAQFQARLVEGAREMMKDMKRQGQSLTFMECKMEMAKVLKENFNII